MDFFMYRCYFFAHNCTRAEFEDFSTDNFSRFLIIDDKLHSIRKNPDIEYNSTVESSHTGTTVILSSQVILGHSGELKTYYSNCTALFVTRSRRAAMITLFSSNAVIKVSVI